MFILILIVIVAVVVYAIAKSEKKWNGESANSIPAEVPGIMDFLDAFYSLCGNHKIESSNVLISWTNNSDGSNIKIYTKIFKIDDMDASESVDGLRRRISQAKSEIEINHKGMEPIALYKEKEKAAQELILNYFGANRLQGVFWDIEDCEYADGKYLEFEAEGAVYKALNQSREKTVNYICAEAARKYPNFHVSMEKNGIIAVSFSK